MPLKFHDMNNLYRSPYTNKYFPILEKALYPSAHLRIMEEKAQIIFEEYLKLYYGQGIINVYLADKEDNGFTAFILIKKGIDK